ncbi:EscU/YscU/HrcU family type III secretion system export apparatus switch protein [Caproiciproducens sp. CPB-2]|uniref:EscU/YscU/HrcU family type III secretion system export apparatus switch protein n=1 Tax=Caproiciproducens sp. CPB-2 TaxID=3030017 RepID=UPI0023DC8C02|nr:EscU/YscU/HrcU family type III secretion system export apparatus switch protein [Caproiciproducens sp. CPB-2]MDF1494272.1 EscU/YscU/HrcU family type III secretion system export apparatus switch protein [Caproiciproducens sp. CPB-2]
MSQYDRTNHAAALRYAQDSPHSAPVVVASGSGYAAQKIIDIAQENGVPVYHDDSLASLLSQLEAGTEIPPELYQAIVDIYVYFLNYSFEAAGKGTAPSQKDPVPAPEKSPEKQIFSEL